MKRILLIVAFLGALVYAAPIKASPTMRIAVVDNSKFVQTATLQRDLPYFQQYADQVCSYWACAADLYLADTAPATGPVVFITDWSTVLFGALGYHEFDGSPDAYVFAKISNMFSTPWASVFTHELGEMLVDPCACASSDTSLTKSDPEFTLLEIADPVQQHWYKLGPVTVSDFVLPAWFYRGSKGPYDIMRKLQAPTEVNKGWKGVWSNGSWHSVNKLVEGLPYAGVS